MLFAERIFVFFFFKYQLCQLDAKQQQQENLKLIYIQVRIRKMQSLTEKKSPFILLILLAVCNFEQQPRMEGEKNIPKFESS